MASHLKVDLRFQPGLFDELPIRATPVGLDVLLELPATTPQGSLLMKFARGQRENRDALIWETVVVSPDATVPEMPGGFIAWLGSAHGAIHDLFFKMIAGELEEKFL